LTECSLLAEQPSNLHLILTHHQRLLYISARKFAGNEENIKEWQVKQFTVSYSTVKSFVHHFTSSGQLGGTRSERGKEPS